MTLKEKIFNAVFDNAWAYKHENTVPELEIIADEFAIGFAEWKDLKYFDNEDGFYNTKYKDDAFTLKELLEIYKKEKGL